MSSSIIVLIDDDFDKRFILARLLEAEFPDRMLFEFEDCSAAELLVFSPYSKIVITNGSIAGKDGIDFAARVTQETDAPVIIISLRSEIKQRALDAGVMFFIETDEKGEINAAVRQALDVAESATKK